MNPEIKERWIAALESGDYEFGTDSLKQCGPDGIITWCGLGVLCQLHSDEFNVPWKPIHLEDGYSMYQYQRRIGGPPLAVMQWAGLDKLVFDGKHISVFNDNAFNYLPFINAVKEYL